MSEFLLRYPLAVPVAFGIISGLVGGACWYLFKRKLASAVIGGITVCAVVIALAILFVPAPDL